MDREKFMKISIHKGNSLLHFKVHNKKNQIHRYYISLVLFNIVLFIVIK